MRKKKTAGDLLKSSARRSMPRSSIFKKKEKQSLRTGYVPLIGKIMFYCGDIPRRLAMDGNPSLSLIHQSLQATVIEVHLRKRQVCVDINNYTFEWKNGGLESLTRILLS